MSEQKKYLFNLFFLHFSNTRDLASLSEPSTSCNVRRSNHLHTNNNIKNGSGGAGAGGNKPQLPPKPSKSRNDEYRPPVPPHRNVGVTANVVRNHNA